MMISSSLLPNHALYLLANRFTNCYPAKMSYKDQCLSWVEPELALCLEAQYSTAQFCTKVIWSCDMDV